jgi:hypothetical protein
MKRYLAGITILFLLGTFSWGQGTKESFDVTKSGEELEIMKGILNTTLTFYAQNSHKESSDWRFSNITAFYLAGQGAVFVIPSSSFRFFMPNFSYNFNLGPEFNEQMASLNQEIRALSSNVAQDAARIAQEAQRGASGVGSGVGGGVDGSVVPAPPAHPAAPLTAELGDKQARIDLDREKLRKAVEDAQAKVKNLREQTEAKRQKLLQEMSEVKVYLIEALANYGDSITTVKPDEYINLVFVTDKSNVISARKSWITDYKAGKLNLEGFKQKVIQYTE